MDGQMNVAYLLQWSQQFLCNVIIPPAPWTPNFINPYQGGGRDPPFCSCMKTAWYGCDLSPGWCSKLLDVLKSPATPPALALTILMWKASLLVFSQAQINYCHWLLSFIMSLAVLLSCYSSSLISITNEDVNLVFFIILQFKRLGWSYHDATACYCMIFIPHNLLSVVSKGWSDHVQHIGLQMNWYTTKWTL